MAELQTMAVLHTGHGVEALTRGDASHLIDVLKGKTAGSLPDSLTPDRLPQPVPAAAAPPLDRDTRIMREWSINAAIAFYGLQASTEEATLAEVFEVAERLLTWVQA
jgi:hypothetical protein